MKMKMKMDTAVSSLHNSIEKLKQKKIDPQISTEYSTLYEFIDEEAVNELTSKAYDFLRELGVCVPTSRILGCINSLPFFIHRNQLSF